MKRSAILLLAIGMVLSGCSNHPDENIEVASPGRSVTRVLHGAQGTEHWTSITAIPHGTGFLDVEEVFDLNRRGSMAQGYIRVRDPQGFWNREIWFEPKYGAVVVRHRGSTQRLSVPTDSAWILAPLEGPEGRPLVTPLAAWITYRATQENAVVRMIDVAHSGSSLVPSEQWSIATDQGTTVIVGDSGADIDTQFVATLHDGPTDLVRQAASADGWFIFRRINGSGKPSSLVDAPNANMRGGGAIHPSTRAAP